MNNLTIEKLQKQIDMLKSNPEYMIYILAGGYDRANGRTESPYHIYKMFDDIEFFEYKIKDMIADQAIQDL